MEGSHSHHGHHHISNLSNNINNISNNSSNTTTADLGSLLLLQQQIHQEIQNQFSLSQINPHTHTHINNHIHPRDQNSLLGLNNNNNDNNNQNSNTLFGSDMNTMALLSPFFVGMNDPNSSSSFMSEFDDTETLLSPLVSPAITPSTAFGRLNINCPQGIEFTALTSPVLQPTHPSLLLSDPNIAFTSDNHNNTTSNAIYNTTTNSIPTRTIRGRGGLVTTSTSPYIIPRKRTSLKQSPALNPTRHSHSLDSLPIPLQTNQILTPPMSIQSSSGEFSPVLLPMHTSSSSSSSTQNFIAPASISITQSPLTPSQIMQITQHREPEQLHENPSPESHNDNSPDSDSDPTTPHDPELKKHSHKEAEKRRRDTLKASLEDLKKIVPKAYFPGKEKPSKIVVLQKCVEFINDLRRRESEQERVISELRMEVERLRALK